MTHSGAATKVGSLPEALVPPPHRVASGTGLYLSTPPLKVTAGGW
jgi:hypothetical protein